jgi:cobalt/nickel transport system permease protein
MFVMTMGMSVRYIYLLVEQVQHFYLALKSRTGQVTSSSVGQKTVAWNVLGLWQRSYRMHDQVYAAMLARGFSGEPRIADTFKMRVRDWLFLILALGAVGGSLWLNGPLK